MSNLDLLAWVALLVALLFVVFICIKAVCKTKTAVVSLPSHLSLGGFVLGPVMPADVVYTMPGLKVSCRINGKLYSTIIRMEEEEHERSK